MAKRVKFHPSERLDLPDVGRMSHEYTDDVAGEVTSETVAKAQLRVLRPFRILIDDQSTPSSYGAISVYGGSYVEPSGRVITKTSTGATPSVSTTLVGANATFFIEVEADVSLTDNDGRSFIDPTYDNGTDISGRSFPVTVPTREDVSWRLVTPISTSGFAVTANPASTRLPVAILRTNGLGQIEASSLVNPGLVLEEYKTHTSEYAPSGADVLRVHDVGPITFGFTITITHALSGATTTQSVLSVNSQASTVTLAAPLPFSVFPGSTVVLGAGNVAVQLRSDAFTTFTLPSSHPDKQLRVFGGNEIVGKALVTASSTQRTDATVQNFKDYADFVANQIYELKVGGLSTNPLYQVSGARYHSYVGSIAGAKTVTLTIGDGVTSFGDMNGQTHTVIQRAIDYATTNSITNLTLFIKKGLYTLSANNSVVIPATMQVHFKGEPAFSTGILNPVTQLRFSLPNGSAGIVSSGPGLSFEDIGFEINSAATAAFQLVYQDHASAALRVHRCSVFGASNVDAGIFGKASAGPLFLDVDNLYVGITGAGAATKTVFAAPSFFGAVNYVTGSGFQTTLLDSGTPAAGSTLVLSNCLYTSNGSQGRSVVYLRTASGCEFRNNKFTHQGTDAAILADNLIYTHLQNNTILCTAGAETLSFPQSTASSAVGNTFTSTGRALDAPVGVVNLVSASSGQAHVGLTLKDNTVSCTFVGGTVTSTAALVEFGIGSLRDSEVSNNSVTAPNVPGACIGMLSNAMLNVTIADNTLVGGSAGVYAPRTSAGDRNNVVVKDNNYTGLGTAITGVTNIYGVYVVTGDATGGSFTLSGNKIRNLGSATNVYGIFGQATGTGTTVHRFDISHNDVTDCIATGVTDFYGITVQRLTSGGGASARFTNNHVSNVTSALNVHGIYARDGFHDHVCDNQIYSLYTESNASTGHVYGIMLRRSTSSIAFKNVVVSNNTITTLTNNHSAATFSDCWGIYLDNVRADVSVNNNSISDMFVDSGRGGVGIYAIGSDSVTIGTNPISSVSIGMRLENPGTVGRNEFSITGNTLRFIDAVGIDVDAGITDYARSISGNTITLSGSAAFAGINLLQCNGVSIGANTIVSRNTTVNNTLVGIRAHLCDDLNIGTNTLTSNSTPTLASSTTNYRSAIYLSSCNGVSVSNNMMRWQYRTSPSSITVTGELLLSACTEFSVTANNVVTGIDGAAGAALGLAFGALSKGFVGSNFARGFNAVVMLAAGASLSDVAYTTATMPAGFINYPTEA